MQPPDIEPMLAAMDLSQVTRPISPSDPSPFTLTYVRTTTRNAVPILVIPGGPGLGSVLPYLSLRQEAERRGLELVMAEHRGVGLSRTDADGGDLPPEAITIDQVVDDLVAVLDDAEVDRAVVHGSSYGSYLAQALAVRHPARVAGLVLDSPMLSVGDTEVARDHLRRHLWNGEQPATATLAGLLREAVGIGAVPETEVSGVIPPVYELCGPATVEALLRLRLAGRGQRLWDRIAATVRMEMTDPVRFWWEFDLVGRIAFRELGYAPAPDGEVLDVNLAFDAIAERFDAFAGEPIDLPAHLPALDVPIAVISGDRDLRTPRPVAERLVATAPDAVLVPLADTGHSTLDTHRSAALHVAHAVQVGGHRELPRLAHRLAALPRRGRQGALATMLRVAIRSREFATRPLPARRTGPPSPAAP